MDTINRLCQEKQQYLNVHILIRQESVIFAKHLLLAKKMLLKSAQDRFEWWIKWRNRNTRCRLKYANWSKALQHEHVHAQTRLLYRWFGGGFFWVYSRQRQKGNNRKLLRSENRHMRVAITTLPFHLWFLLTNTAATLPTLLCCEGETLDWASEVNTADIPGTYGIRLSLPPDLTPSLFWT